MLETTGRCHGKLPIASMNWPRVRHRPEGHHGVLDQRLGRRVIAVAELEAFAVDDEIAPGDRSIERDGVTDEILQRAP